MPDKQDDSPASAPQPQPVDELVQRLEKQVKATVAGTIGSLIPRLSRVEELLAELSAERAASRVQQMTTEQLREEVAKNKAQGSLPSASEYFSQMARRAREDAGLGESDVDIPEFTPGKKTQDYVDLYQGVLKRIYDQLRASSKTLEAAAQTKKEQADLAALGLHVTDAGSGSSPSNLRFTKEQLESMSPEEYTKYRDDIHSTIYGKR